MFIMIKYNGRFSAKHYRVYLSRLLIHRELINNLRMGRNPKKTYLGKDFNLLK